MNLFPLSVVISCLCGVAFSQFTLWPGSSETRDCEWQKWKNAEKGDCVKINDKNYAFEYGIKMNRDTIPARSGGKNCTGKAVKYTECNEIQHVGSRFFEAVKSQLKTPGKAGSAVGSRRLELNNPCAPDFFGSDGTIRMMGKCRKIKRKQRSAEGFVKVVEVPLNEGRSRVKRQGAPPVLSTSHRDVLFLLDESGSIGRFRFKKKLLRMASVLANQFCGAISIGKETTRVGVMTFDSTTHFHLNFDKYFEKSQVVNFINNTVKYTKKTGWSTCMIKALETTRKEMFTSARGARVNNADTTERIVVLFTDGCANCENDDKTPGLLKKARAKFVKMNIPFIVFFVGDDEKCVKKMNGLADGSRCYQVFRAKDWDEFDTMIDQVESQSCMDAWYIGQSCT